MAQDPQGEFRFADRELLASLVALLPLYVVTVRTGLRGPLCPFVPYLAASLIERALCEGWDIDRSNGDGLLAEWDGWLKIETPDAPTFLLIALPGGGKLT